MGADYTAKAIIGICLPDEEDIPRALISVRKKAFSHNYKDNEQNEFHPKDGRKLWLDEKEQIKANYPAFVFDKHDELNEDSIRIGQKIIKIPEELEFATGTDDNNLCLGFVLETGSSNGGQDLEFVNLPNIDKMKTQLKNLLEPLNLWDEANFGLYSMLYCSY